MPKTDRVTEFQLPVRVSDQLLADVLLTAFEAGHYGIGYWANKARLRVGDNYDPLDDPAPAEGPAEDTLVLEPFVPGGEEVWNEYLCRNVVEGGSLTIYDVADSGDEGSPTPWCLTRDKLVAGFGQFLLEGRPQGVELDAQGLLTFDDDGEQADRVVQYALFGDVIYG